MLFILTKAGSHQTGTTVIQQNKTKKKNRPRLATSRPLGERSEPCLPAKRPTASDAPYEKILKSDEGLF